MKRSTLVFLFSIGFLFFGRGTISQTTLFDSARLQEMCVELQCLIGTQTSVQSMQTKGMSSEELNSQIGVIAALLFELARTANDPQSRDISQALLFLSLASDDADQIESLIWISQQVLNGGNDLFDLSAPFAVSPS